MLKKVGTHLLGTVTVLLLLVIAAGAVILPSENLALVQEQVSVLDSGWNLEGAAVSLHDTDLPARLDINAGEPYTASRILDEDFHEEQVLLIRSSMQQLEVSVGADLIFTSSQPQRSRNVHLLAPPASLWHLVRIPAGSAGKVLSLRMSSPVAAFSGLVNPVLYASGQALIYHLVRQEFPAFVLTFWLMLIGLIFLIIHLFVYRQSDNRLYYLGLFTLAMSLWILSETRMLQLFVSNRFLIGGLSYLLVTFMPIPFIFYLKNIILTGYARILNLFSLLFSLLLAVNLTLQLAGAAHFIESMPITLVSLIILGMSVVFMLIREGFTQGNPAARKFGQYALVLMFFSVLEIGVFFFGVFDFTSSFLRIGIIVFFVFLVLDTIGYINDLLVKKQEAKLFEKMAFTDMLTGILNRNAFERDVQHLQDPASGIPFRLILLDLNGLKGINDQWGHKQGDNAIIETSRALHAAFGQSGTCYRISGDEFAVITRVVDEFSFREQENTFRLLLERFSASVDYHLNAAVGSLVYERDESREFSAFYHDVDALMYAHKNQQKKETADIFY
jgi:diguanylate cyclase (GGDEF)-like protein